MRISTKLEWERSTKNTELYTNPDVNHDVKSIYINKNAFVDGAPNAITIVIEDLK